MRVLAWNQKQVFSRCLAKSYWHTLAQVTAAKVDKGQS